MSELLPDKIPSIEKAPTPEGLETTQAAEIVSVSKEQVTSLEVPAAPAASAANARALQDPKIVEIEGIMASGLDEVYMSLPAIQRQKFRIMGEQTAQQIKDLLQSGKANWKKIQDLLLRWLKLIPGVNKYFLEKEAKLKADRLMKLQ